MRIEEVRKMKPLERFLYWIHERHAIYLRKEAGQDKPWTDDEILQNYFFTNPYRENDKVTKWFREKVRGPLSEDPRVVFATIAFRWFNLPETGLTLMGHWPAGTKDEVKWRKEGRRSVPDRPNLLLEWDPKEALRRLAEVRSMKRPVFTGAFMINSPGGEPKLEAIIRRVTNVWEDREALRAAITEPEQKPLRLKDAHRFLLRYEGLGGFMAYEVVCDLRYTEWLRNAPDKMTWCNPGPGAIRGAYRVKGIDFPKGNNSSSPPKPKDWDRFTAGLLLTCRRRLGSMNNTAPDFEMREVEHSLCEFDKYERMLWGDGRAKRVYNGV